MNQVQCRVQMGIKPGSDVVTLTLDQEAGVEQIAHTLSAQSNISVQRFNLIYNGKAFFRYGKVLDMYQGWIIRTLGVTSGSLIICIVSRDVPESQKTEEQKTTEALGAPAEVEDKADHKVVLTCEFKKRPFGFAVWANAQGKNAIVTKVAGANALKLGIQIGYVVYRCNNQIVYGKPHDEVLEQLKTTPCPLTLEFADLGEQYVCQFKSKPLGFTVIQDREENNAKVSKINTRAAQGLGVLIGSYVVGVNTEKVFGKKHKAIINSINKAQFPINIIFRHPPPLLMLAPRSRTRKRTGKR